MVRHFFQTNGHSPGTSPRPTGDGPNNLLLPSFHAASSEHPGSECCFVPTPADSPGQALATANKSLAILTDSRNSRIANYI
jgi:hypothetical protein